MTLYCLAAALVLLPLSALAGERPLQPFEASFTVSRNDKPLGTMVMRLESPRAGEWLFSSRTEGEKGLASFLGVTIEERSALHDNDGALTSSGYRYQQDMVGRHRSRSLEIADGQARESDNDERWSYPVAGEVLDRHAAVLGIAAHLANGAGRGTLFEVPVASKGKLESWRFLVAGAETVDTGEGRMEAVRVERVRENADRKTVSWHAERYGWLPVRVEQIEPDGERLVSVLREFQQQ
ncbi:MAG: DUF3108 domain-containing protein [Xanthomonadales bacterium]|nr:hypothetical protein [Xanthomonadales bacterium]MCC6593228.1 DUF3108 domain-containing protein [Xanthomonadales bacterium]